MIWGLIAIAEKFTALSREVVAIFAAEGVRWFGAVVEFVERLWMIHFASCENRFKFGTDLPK